MTGVCFKKLHDECTDDFLLEHKNWIFPDMHIVTDFVCDQDYQGKSLNFKPDLFNVDLNLDQWIHWREIVVFLPG